jgi:hypothetical protein
MRSCGAMTHKTKDCLERPRSKGAKWTNKNIAPDEKVEDIRLTAFESKRDRWNGYDSKEYARVVDRFEQLEEMRKDIKKKEQVCGLGGQRVLRPGMVVRGPFATVHSLMHIGTHGLRKSSSVPSRMLTSHAYGCKPQYELRWSESTKTRAG